MTIRDFAQFWTFVFLILQLVQGQYEEISSSAVTQQPTRNYSPNTSDSDQSYNDPMWMTSTIGKQEILDAMQQETKMQPSPSTGMSQCSLDISNFLFGVIHGKRWALTMLDAFGKPQSGILKGNWVYPGSYSSCLDVEKIATNNFSTDTFRTQYCWFSFIPDLHKQISEKKKLILERLQIYISLCLPESCSEGELMERIWFFSHLLRINPNDTSLHIKCIPRNREFWKDIPSVISLVICCFFGLLLIVATIYDVGYVRKKRGFQYSNFSLTEREGLKDGCIKNGDEQKIQQPNFSQSNENNDAIVEVIQKQHPRLGLAGEVLLAFSVYTNGQAILTTAVSPKETIKTMNGIRFFSMLWVILAHAVWIELDYTKNALAILDLRNDITTVFIAQATLCMNTFFCLSGLVLSYSFLKLYEAKQGKIPWIKFYTHRFIRLNPAYFAVLFLFQMNLSNYLSKGPFWPQNGFEGDKCDNGKWLMNVFYINNFISSEKACMEQSWYLAVDTQLYLLSPILLIPLAKRWFKWANIIAGGCVVFSTICIGTLAAAYHFLSDYEQPFNSQTTDSFREQFNVLYTKPHMRLGVYSIGILSGFLLYENNGKVIMKKQWVTFGWTAALTSLLGIIFIVYHTHLNVTATAFYLAFGTHLWALSIGWIVIACTSGYGGIFNSILSWPVWNPLGRLTLAVYLIHIGLLRASYAQMEIRPQFCLSVWLYQTLAVGVLIYAAALIVSLTFESPILALEKVIQKKYLRSKK